MLKNPKKADLDKDGKLSSYEKRRGMAIEKNMKVKKAALGAIALGAIGAKALSKVMKKKLLLLQLWALQIKRKINLA